MAMILYAAPGPKVDRPWSGARWIIVSVLVLTAVRLFVNWRLDAQTVNGLALGLALPTAAQLD